ncbi:MAG: hypothetical protein ACREVZ_07790, partial [Burkholderiales bacterium]
GRAVYWLSSSDPQRREVGCRRSRMPRVFPRGPLGLTPRGLTLLVGGGLLWAVDGEYLDRLTAIGGVLPSRTATHSAGERLARATAVACYAPRSPRADADDAELAAADLRHHLLDPLPVHRRLGALARGLVVTALRAPLERGRRRAR